MRSIGTSGVLAGLLLLVSPAAPQHRTMPVLLKKSGPLRSSSVFIPNLKTSSAYSLLFSVRTARSFGPDSRVSVEVIQGAAELLHKTLHGGDPDFFALFRVPREGSAEVRIAVVSPMAAPATYRLQVSRWEQTREGGKPSVAGQPRAKAAGAGGC